ncbi:hypothetical protein [Methyloprofundus sp.]|uniref:hypothetical protein n=1 Tax=Methyloprofundus sp. TaxID=2020875 RepID=UPI003D10F582
MLSHIIGAGVFLNSTVKAEDRIYFSRANCALPQDIFQLGKTRNESVTWDPYEFYGRISNPSKDWRFWGIATFSNHWTLGVIRHTVSDLETFGIHSAATHLDIASQSLWGATGRHFYRGPFQESDRNTDIIYNGLYVELPETAAIDCNLQISQFFG